MLIEGMYWLRVSEMNEEELREHVLGTRFGEKNLDWTFCWPLLEGETIIDVVDGYYTNRPRGKVYGNENICYDEKLDAYVLDD